MTSGTAKPRQASERCGPFEHLLQMIESGELRSGRRLRETELAQQLGISRTPVRQALHRLQDMGLAEPGPQRGLIVAHMSYDQLRQLFALREGLEGMATRLAACHASAAEIALLQEMVSEDARTSDPAVLIQSNKRFHRQIVLASHNAYMIEALNNLSVHLGLLPGSTYAGVGRIQTAQAEHEAIVDAIASRQGARAEAAARKHISSGLTIRLRMLTQGS